MSTFDSCEGLGNRKVDKEGLCYTVTPVCGNKKRILSYWVVNIQGILGSCEALKVSYSGGIESWLVLRACGVH